MCSVLRGIDSQQTMSSWVYKTLNRYISYISRNVTRECEAGLSYSWEGMIFRKRSIGVGSVE